MAIIIILTCAQVKIVVCNLLVPLNMFEIQKLQLKEVFDDLCYLATFSARKRNETRVDVNIIWKNGVRVKSLTD